MFSHELDRRQQPLLTRSRGILLGSILTVAVVAALVSARTVPFLYAVTVAAFLAAAAARGVLGTAVPRRGPVSLHLAAFLAYAFVSASWALEPATTISMTSLAILVAAGTLVLMQLVAEETRPNLLHMGEGIWIGLLVGLCYLFIELVSGQSIKLWVYNMLSLHPSSLPHIEYYRWSGDKLTYISPEDLTRNMAPVALFLWPVVMAAMGTLRRRSGLVVSGLTVLLAGVVILLAEHDTSKLAFVAGLSVFASAYVAARPTGRMVAVGWVIACLAVLPSALIVHRLDLHNAPWLPGSARHRIIIWNHTAEQVLNAPWLGVGARSTYLLGPRLEHEPITRPDEAFTRTLSAHSHSIYLQTWFELGLVGATLLTVLGLAILQAIRSLAGSLQPYAYATFVSAAVMAASSYGMWQIWFVSMFGLTAALVGLGASLLATRYGADATIGSRTLEHDVTVRA
ncbi:MAG TPA: O-antigen ligase family protein [Hyphomicrobium sp.]